MSAPAPEFSRPVALARVGAEPFHQRIEATAEEREKLARRFDLVSLDCLAAEVALQRQSTGLILLEAEFAATFEQWCVVTLEPVPGTLSSRFSLVCGPAPKHEPEIDVSDDEPVFEPVTGDSIDIGEAVAQELSLTLPAFPRDPEAIIDQAAMAKPFEGPFAALAHLRQDPEC